MKIYITKYALTKGILEKDAERHETRTSTAVVGYEGNYYEYFHGQDWHLTRELAVLRANEMAAAKIKSLKKSLKKLEKLKFS